MQDLPNTIIFILSNFLPLFSAPSFSNFLLLLQGHILCNGKRTIANILRRLGLKNIKNYSKYHHFFSKAKWSALKGAQILFLKLVSLTPNEVTIIIDSTIERRKGPKIRKLGMQRDPVRSTRARKVIVPGLNWLVCAIQIKFPWTTRQLALPFLTILMPPEKSLSSSKHINHSKKKKHKTLNEWACQAAKIIRKWLGNSKKVIIVADSSFATYALANTCIDLNITLISRMRLDARTFDFPPQKSGRGRKRLVGARLPTFKEMLEDPKLNWEKTECNWYGAKKQEIKAITGCCLWYGYGIRPVPIKWILIRNLKEPAVLFSTNINISSTDIIEKFIGRWQLEVTFEEARRHLGMETQRQWSDQAIDKITPCILASYSIINLIAFELKEEIPIQTTSWYKKTQATFSDILTHVREKILQQHYFLWFEKNMEPKKIDIEEWIALITAA